MLSNCHNWGLFQVSVYILFFSQVDPELISIHHKKLHIPSDQGGHASLKVQRASQQELCGSIVHGISVPKPTWHGAKAKNEDESLETRRNLHALSHLNQVLSRSSRSCQSLLKPLHFWWIYTLSRCVCVCVVSLFLSHHPLSNLRSSSSRFSSWGGNWSYDRLVGGFKPSWDHHPILYHPIPSVGFHWFPKSKCLDEPSAGLRFQL